MLSYAYLWAWEAAQGRDEGAKDRPVVVVVASEVRDGLTEVLVVPVTTQPPRGNDGSVEMPAAVKAHLGLDDKRCWIVVGELNRFIWPGPDIRPVQKGGEMTPYYGKVPGKLLEKVRVAMAAHVGRLKVTKRTE